MAARGWLAGLLLVATLVTFAFAQAPVPPVEKRVALVIGNGRYTESPLNNPVNDAKAITRVLRSLGFDVLSHENLDFIAMRRAVVEFGERMSAGGVGLFYYSGHGLQVDGRNYLVPTTARLTSERYIAAETLEVDAVLKEMDAARNRLNIVVLDACRNNPFARGWRSAARGLAQMSGPPGTFIAYATDPGDVASDGAPGTNGVYTSELIRALPLTGLTIEEAFKRAARGVIDKTNSRQRPWVSSSFTGEFQFARPATAAPSRPAAAVVGTVPEPSPEPRRPVPPPDDQIAKPDHPGWTVDAGTGCSVWNPRPLEGETVNWTGACSAEGRATGRGVLEWRAGDKVGRYEGEMRDGKRTGRGISVSSDGNRYEGDFRDGKFDGRGVATSASGNRFEGDFREGKPNGRTIFTHANGNRYEGNVRDGKFDGPGVLIFASGARFDGNFRDGKFNGRGVSTFPNGSRFEGEFRDGKPNGTGTLSLGDGTTYTGTWTNGCFREGPRYAYVHATAEECGAKK